MSNLSASDIPRLLAEAQKDQAAGRREQAAAKYQQILAHDPHSAPALMLLASMLAHEGNYDPAFELLQRAMVAKPADPAPCNVMAVTLAAANCLAEAEAACRRSLALDPRQPQMQGWLGGLLLRLHRPEEAAVAFRAVLQANDSLAEAHRGLASALRDLGDLAGALAACHNAVERKPQDPKAHMLLVQLLIESGDSAAARDAADRGVALHPNSEELHFARAALVGEQVTTAPTDYVAAVFDNHAEHYDTVLVDELQARSHQYVYEAVRSVGGERQFDILDMGCGTGLCGPLFKTMAKSLDGIDLSRAMLLRARERNVYDRLGTGELVGFLRQAAVHSYDLALAADVFVYVGDLAETFALVAQVLRPAGLFSFTVEAIDGPGFTLRQTMRFGHSQAYLQELATKNGFLPRYAELRPLRQEHGTAVMGWVVALAKPA